MSTNEKLFEPEGRPTRLPGETYAQWQARLEAWRRGVVGDEAELSRTLLAPSVGIPPASPRFAPSPTGERLGDFRVTGTADLPAPRITHPAGESPAASPAAPPSSGPSVPAWARPAMGGALPPGLRPPPTAEEEQSSERRRWVLEVTGFDLAWGTPPDVEGLRWSPERFLYEPTADAQSVPYRGPASRGFYRQAYSNPTLGPGAWGWRWVEARTTRPDPAYPYRVVERGEASALDLEVNNARLHRRAPEAEGARTIDVGTLPTGRVPLPSPAPAIVRRPRMTDFAWIPQQDLPIGCPYPHAYLPVPRQDYVSGRWLLPDYVPSIPLPPPYDQTPWQCGKSVAQESKKGKGGGGPPPEGYHVPGGGMDPLSERTDISYSATSTLDVGIPPPGGTVYASDAPDSGASALAHAETGPFPSGLRIPCTDNHSKTYMPSKDASGAAGPGASARQQNFTKYHAGAKSPRQNTETDCKKARGAFLRKLNADLASLNPGLKLRFQAVADQPDFVQLIDETTGRPADVADFNGKIADLIRLVNNGNIGMKPNPLADAEGRVRSKAELENGDKIPRNSNDPRLEPTTIFLVNRNYSYDDPRGDRERAHIGVTPAQDLADGRIYFNVDARSAYDDLRAGDKQSGFDPLNVAVQVFHEMSEHEAGAQEWSAYVSRPLGGGRSGRTQEELSPRERSVRPPDPDAIERRANAQAIKDSNGLLRDFKHPERSEKSTQSYSDGSPQYFFPKLKSDGSLVLPGHEMPATLKVLYEVPASTGGGEPVLKLLTIDMDAQGVPTSKPRFESWPR